MRGSILEVWVLNALERNMNAVSAGSQLLIQVFPKMSYPVNFYNRSQMVIRMSMLAGPKFEL